MSAFPGYYLTGDGGYFDDDGYLYVMGRTDDVINVAGHRLSTGSMEEVLAGHPDVAECAVFGIADPLKGQLPRGLVVLKSGVPNDYESEKRLCAELVKMVREQIGAVAALREVSVVAALPKTRSGKILRKTMGNIADGQTVVVPSTIDDASVLDALRPILRHDTAPTAAAAEWRRTARETAIKGEARIVRRCCHTFILGEPRVLLKVMFPSNVDEQESSLMEREFL